MWQILLWCQMTTLKHYPLRKREFYKGQNWEINGRYLGRARFAQLLSAYIAGLDWQTLENYIHRSTEPVILDLWLACEPCQTIIIKYPHTHTMWLIYSAPVIIQPPLWSTGRGKPPRYWMELGPRDSGCVFTSGHAIDSYQSTILKLKLKLNSLSFHDNRTSHTRDTIWPWNFNVKGTPVSAASSWLISVVFHIRASYRLPSLSFHDNRASHSRDTIWLWKFKIKGQGQRSRLKVP